MVLEINVRMQYATTAMNFTLKLKFVKCDFSLSLSPNLRAENTLKSLVILTYPRMA
jgi:hypothetical protein